MKKRIKYILILLVILLIVSCIPIPMHCKDGGTVKYKAILYTYIHWHVDCGDNFENVSKDPKYKKYYKNGYFDRKNYTYFLQITEKLVCGII